MGKYTQDNSHKNKNYKNSQRKKEVKSNQKNLKIQKVHNKLKSKKHKQKGLKKNGISYHNSKNSMLQIRIPSNQPLLNFRKNKKGDQLGC